jgi:HSP20 family molecular chaperone IbpA
MTTSQVTLTQREAGQSQPQAQSALSLPEFRPRVDVYENVDELLMLADMPGASAESVAVRLEGAELTMDAQRSIGG